MTSLSNPVDKNVTEELVNNILETRFERFNEAILRNVRTRIMDVIGCLISGAKAPGNLGLVNLIKEWGGKREATIPVYGGKVLAQNVAMIGCIMARSYDFEPNSATIDNLVIPTHISGTTVMTALTMGEMMAASGKELITAMLAGENLATRILAASSSQKRVDSIGTGNVFAATAIAGRLLGLNTRQLRNALGISLDCISGSYQNVWDGTISFKLSQGLAARSGVFAAQLAQRGWQSTPDPLLGKFAYYYLYTDNIPNNIEILTKDLGKKYYTEAQVKPYPSCRYNHGPIACVLSLVHKNQIEVADIKEVTVFVSQRGLKATVAKPFNIGEFPYANALFSYQYTVASALVRKDVRIEHFFEESIREPEVNALIKKIKLAELPSAILLESRVEITMNDGRTFSAAVEAPKGDQKNNPMSEDELIAKFWANIEFSKVIAKRDAQKLLKLIDRIEELDNVNRIIRLLVAR